MKTLEKIIQDKILMPHQTEASTVVEHHGIVMDRETKALIDEVQALGGNAFIVTDA